MFIKLFVISFFMVSLVMLTLGIKMLFDRNAEFTFHSCGSSDGENPEEAGCHSCQLKDLANCSENEKIKPFKELSS